MPEMDGLELAKEMRHHPSLAGTSIIGASATVSDSVHKETFATVCDDFIIKPINIDLLLDKIRMHLQIVWKTAQSKTSTLFGSESEGCRENLILPPAEDMKELYELGLLGDMRRIQDWATRLENSDGKYEPFAGKLRELASGFKTKAILSLVERHTGEGK